MLSGEATNTNFIVFGLTPIWARIHDLTHWSRCGSLAVECSENIARILALLGKHDKNDIVKTGQKHLGQEKILGSVGLAETRVFFCLFK